MSSQRDVQKVIALIRGDFPAAVDYNVVERSRKHYAEVQDKDDKRIGWISADQLDRYWNRYETVKSACHCSIRFGVCTLHGGLRR